MSGDGVPPVDARVYVNERGVSVPHGSCALDAVRALLPDDAARVSLGTMRLTDSRGLPLDPMTVVSGGLIVRTLPVRTTDAGAAP